MPSGRSEDRGMRSALGIATGSTRNVTPATVRKPSRNVAPQKATTFVTSSAEKPQPE